MVRTVESKKRKNLRELLKVDNKEEVSETTVVPEEKEDIIEKVKPKMLFRVPFRQQLLKIQGLKLKLQFKNSHQLLVKKMIQTQQGKRFLFQLYLS